MAAKSFLTQIDIEWALKKLRPAHAISIRSTDPNFDLDKVLETPAVVSDLIGQKLEDKLAEHPRWSESIPLRLGSWARGELCSKSDIDILFLGPEEAVGEVVADLQRTGFKIRARVPQDRSDWTVGVDSFDVLSLLFSHYDCAGSAERTGSQNIVVDENKDLVLQQIKKIEARGIQYKKRLLQAMVRERKERARRYDSIVNFLEPNLKYGPGGLRDLDQAMMAERLFSEKFLGDEASLSRLRGYKQFFLLVRHWLHLTDSEREGGREVRDTVRASYQQELAEFLRYESAIQFMSDLEFALSEVNFYADWAVEQARTARARQIGPAVLERVKMHPIQALARDSSMLIQKRIREHLFKRRDMIEPFVHTFHPDMSEVLLAALFRAKFLARMIPDLERVTGLVQHDQYHRYSVDAHTFQALREVLRIKRHPRRLGRLAEVASRLKARDWKIIFWAALFHDLGKGLRDRSEKGGHSIAGARIARRELKFLKMPEGITPEIVWLVENHLLMSTAAFRRDSQDPAVWSELFARGLKEGRIARLAILTAVDIRATNIDAWNDWKAQLLGQLVASLESPPAHALGRLVETSSEIRRWAEKLDPRVIESVSAAQLLHDYNQLVAMRSKEFNVSRPVVVKNRRKETWVRFHSPTDRPGLFLDFTRILLSLGLDVQEAFVQTFADLGAYDWFHVKSRRSRQVLQAHFKVLTKNLIANASMSQINGSLAASQAQLWQTIELVSESDRSAIVSFRGRDQRGALMAAAQMIFAEGFEIRSAKVHTWGRQIEDVFTLKKSGPDDDRIRIWVGKISAQKRQL